jgi:predicted ATPase
MKTALTGAHGTGKTSLCTKLKTDGLSGRSITISKEMPRVITDLLGDPTFFQRTNNTLLRQMLLFTYQTVEESMVSSQADVIVCDRTVVDHLAYSVVLFPAFERTQEFAALSAILKTWLTTYQLIFYVPVEFKVVSDGVREDDIDFQARIDAKIRDLYLLLGQKTITISGSIEERATMVRTHLAPKLI